MKKKKSEVGWSLGFFDDDKPRPPRSKQESRYLDSLVKEHSKDEAYAGEFAQFVIRETQRFDREVSESFGNLNTITGRSVASRAKKLGADGHQLIRRIVECRSYKRQLVSVAFDFGMFCMMVDARAAITSEMQMMNKKKSQNGSLKDEKYNALVPIFRELREAFPKQSDRKRLSDDNVNEALLRRQKSVRQLFVTIPLPKQTLNPWKKRFTSENPLS